MKLKKSDIKKMLPILKQYDVVRADVFGSYARGDATQKSDLDLLVEMKGRKSLLDLSSLKLDLQDNLKKNVDVVTYRSIYPPLKSHIYKDTVSIL